MVLPKKYFWMCDIRIYTIWVGMRQRCYNKKSIAYKYYWWRWIYVCSRRWSFENFLYDMHKEYLYHCKKYWKKNTSIDRINNDWEYSKGNCRRATQKKQRANKRKQKNFRKKCYLFETYKWEMLSLKEISVIIDIKYKTLQNRWAKWRRWEKLFQPIRNPWLNYTTKL